MQIAHLVGPKAIVEMGRRLGIRSHLPLELSLALGACEVTPLDLTCAYNSIASGGFQQLLFSCQRVGFWVTLLSELHSCCLFITYGNEDAGEVPADNMSMMMMS